MRAQLAIALAAGLLWPLTSRATTVVAVSEAELVGLADVVVWGTVIELVPVIAGDNRIVTRAKVQVLKGLLGAQKDDVLTVEIPGGRMPDGLSATVPGAPQVRVGDMVFAFLRADGNIHRALGLSFGWLKVRQDAAGSFRVDRDTDNLSLVTRQGTPVAPEQVRLKDEPLDNLMARVQVHLAKAHRGATQGSRP